jgi:hypothetical protein
VRGSWAPDACAVNLRAGDTGPRLWESWVSVFVANSVGNNVGRGDQGCRGPVSMLAVRSASGCPSLLLRTVIRNGLFEEGDTRWATTLRRILPGALKVIFTDPGNVAGLSIVSEVGRRKFGFKLSQDTCHLVGKAFFPN